jgi:hypothetical protein
VKKEVIIPQFIRVDPLIIVLSTDGRPDGATVQGQCQITIRCNQNMNGMYLNGLNFDHCRILKLLGGKRMVALDRYDVVE